MIGRRAWFSSQPIKISRLWKTGRYIILWVKRSRRLQNLHMASDFSFVKFRNHRYGIYSYDSVSVWFMRWCKILPANAHGSFRDCIVLNGLTSEFLSVVAGFMICFVADQFLHSEFLFFSSRWEVQSCFVLTSY